MKECEVTEFKEEKAFHKGQSRVLEAKEKSRKKRLPRLSVGSCSHRKILVILVRLGQRSDGWIQEKKREKEDSDRGPLLKKFK